MKVRWLHNDPGYTGGAELTMAEFEAAAPAEVEFVTEDPDVTVVGNFTHPHPAFEGRVVQYHHDMQHPALDATHIFCSPLQRERLVLEGHVIPPALDLERFRTSTNGHRKGNVCIGRMAYGKGLELLADYTEPVDVYSSVPCRSQGNARYLGPTSDVAETLSHYRTFVFLPQAIEPFGRAVVEAWAAGCDLVINRNVGARYWIEENPEGLRTASKDFWEVVCG